MSGFKPSGFKSSFKPAAPAAPILDLATSAGLQHEDVDGENIDGAPLDEDVDGEELIGANTDGDTDGEELEEVVVDGEAPELDGEPMEMDDDTDGAPLEDVDGEAI
jgi:hypothetical protein